MLLEIEDARTGYGRLEVLHGVSLSVAEGEIVTVLGPNGTGKTSADAAAVGRAAAVVGTCLLRRRRARAHQPRRSAPARGLCQLPEGRGIFQTLSVGENLDLGLASRKVSATEAKPDRDRVLDIFPELAGRLVVSASSLSGGQQQMLALARAMMSQPAPAADRRAVVRPRAAHRAATCSRWCASCASQGVTFLIVEQQASALRISDRTYVLRGGRNELDRRSAELLASDDLVASYLR